MDARPKSRSALDALLLDNSLTIESAENVVGALPWGSAPDARLRALQRRPIETILFFKYLLDAASQGVRRVVLC